MAAKPLAKHKLHPLKYTSKAWDPQKVLPYIIEEYASGVPTIKEVLEGKYVDENGDEWPLPQYKTFRKLLAKHPEDFDKYMAAQKVRGDMLFDRAVEVAMADINPDEYDGDPRWASIEVQKRKLQIEMLTSGARVYNPERFNPKLNVNHSGSVEVEQIRQAIAGNGAERLECIVGEAEVVEE